MNAVSESPEATGLAESRISVTEQARIVSGLLKEYAAKLAELNAELLDFSFELREAARLAPRAAWLLDRSELLRKPLSNIISRGSALLEYSTPEAVAHLSTVAPVRVNASLDYLAAAELSLRMREIEVHLHHSLRLTQKLREAVDGLRKAGLKKDLVAELRLAAGLNVMQDSPVNP
jgi:hypothetical protein